MDREVRSQFDEVWAILERTAQRGEQAEARFNRRMDAAERRMDRAVAGMKIVMRNSADIKSLGKRMDAFLRSGRNSHNGGNGHSPRRSR